jgi:23S rRNA (cytidine1920-2'-O)/16S rRNA (cytidine1409-2'-O)-methyltransferase
MYLMLCRLDYYLVQQGLAPTRSKAQQMIKAGVIEVDGQVMTKNSLMLTDEQQALVAMKSDASQVVLEELKDVGRAAQKLRHFWQQQHVLSSVKDQKWLDLGQSTGGFTQVLLDLGAAQVIGVDVGRRQLDVSLRSDPRVSCWEGINAKFPIPPQLAQELPPECLDGITIDVSFISVLKLHQQWSELLRPGGWVLVLIKPQFEGISGGVKNFVLSDDESLERAQQVRLQCAQHWSVVPRTELWPCDLRGKDGNQEFMVAFQKNF